MTLNKIADNVERWEIALQRAQDSQERLKRRLNDLTIKVARLRAKITKYKPYKTYKEREAGK